MREATVRKVRLMLQNIKKMEYREKGWCEYECWVSS